MGFNEMTHAYLAAKYYQYLKEAFGDKGIEAFVHATQYYGMTRGRRMAQKAIKDGKKLNYTTYLEYGEWVSSEELKEIKMQNQAVIVSKTPDYINEIFFCPWNHEFKLLGLGEAGAVYCTYLDEAIARGFNPEIDFKVETTLFNSDRCRHVIRGGDVKDRHGKKMEYVKGFDYHCAHLYYSFKECCKGIFDIEGLRVADKVFADFEKDYGQDMTEILSEYSEHNFNL